MAAPVITPPGPLSKDGKSATAFTADQSVTWGTDGGTLSSITSTSVTWNAPNQTGTWHLTATNGSSQVTTVTITVKALLPNYWTYKNAIHSKKDVQIFRPVYGPSQSRGFGNSSPIMDWELGDDDSSYENYLEMKAFWDWHYPHRQFDMIDPVIGERRTYEIDSDMDHDYNHQDSYTWSFRIKEAYPYVTIP